MGIEAKKLVAQPSFSATVMAGGMSDFIGQMDVSKNDRVKRRHI